MGASSKGAAREGAAIEFSVDGRDYRISTADFTAVEDRLYRREMGESLLKTLDSGDVGIEAIATLVWIVRRRDEPGLTWEDVARTVTYDNVDVIADDADDEDVDPSP